MKRLLNGVTPIWLLSRGRTLGRSNQETKESVLAQREGGWKRGRESYSLSIIEGGTSAHALLAFFVRGVRLIFNGNERFTFTQP